MTGESHIENLKAGGGAGDNLGNHTATQALDMAGNDIVNADVISNLGNMQIRPLSSGGLGSQVIVQAGTSGPTGNGGLLDLRAGQSGGTGRGGHAYFTGGQSNSAEGGNVTVRGGEAAGGSSDGGNAYFGGGPSDNGDGGAAFLYGGTAGINDAGGRVGISTSSSNGDNAGPSVTISTGDANRIGTGSFVGGNLDVTLGSGAGGGAGGTFNVTAGLGRGSGAQEGKGGGINLTAGASNLREGGDVTIKSGEALTDAAGGKIFLTAADGVDGGGSISLTGGASTGTGNFSGAQVALFAGAGGGTFSGQGGDVRLVPGNRATTANADPGSVNIQGMMIRENQTLGTLSSNTTLELDLGFLFIATIQGAASVEFDFGRVRGNVSITCELELTNGGAGTVTWDAAILWPGGVAPTLTVAGIDWLRFSTNDDGVSWYGEIIGLDMS